jgi:hypothetical protein
MKKIIMFIIIAVGIAPLTVDEKAIIERGKQSVEKIKALHVEFEKAKDKK